MLPKGCKVSWPALETGSGALGRDRPMTLTTSRIVQVSLTSSRHNASTDFHFEARTVLKLASNNGLS